MMTLGRFLAEGCASASAARIHYIWPVYCAMHGSKMMQMHAYATRDAIYYIDVGRPITTRALF